MHNRTVSKRFCEIRRASADALDSLVSIKQETHNQYVNHRPDMYQESNLLYSEDFIAGFFTNPDKMILVALHKNRTVGYALIEKVSVNKPMLTAREYIYIHDMAVSADTRNNGVGTELLSEIERLALESGIAKLELAVHLFSMDALQLYKKQGFRVRTFRMEKEII